MKSNHLQFEYRKNASKLHRSVGDCLRESEVFSNYQIYQEYPVVNVNPSYEDTSHHFDWVIPSIKLVIECHGAQHYKPTAWDGDYEKALLAFQEGQSRDKRKKTAALEAGYIYIVVPYTTKNITEDYLIELMKVARVKTEQYNRDTVPVNRATNQAIVAQKKKKKEERKKYLESDRHKEELKKAREYRRERYRKLKQTQSS